MPLQRISAYARLRGWHLSRTWLLASVFAVCLYAPFLSMDKTTDDYVHQWHLEGLPASITEQYSRTHPSLQHLLKSEPATLSGAMMHLFDFFNPEEAQLQAMQEYGIAPWWVDPDLKLRFWRPLTAITHWLDYQLWPDNTTIMRLHTLAWFLILLALLIKLYTQVFSLSSMPHSKPQTLYSISLISSLSVLVFVFDYSHISTIAWIASRNAIVSAVFGTLFLLCHLRWRRSGLTHWGLLSAPLLLLTYFAAEGGIAIGAFVLAYACVFETTLKQRALSVLPSAFVFLFWKALHSHLHYGSANNAMYLDPLLSPLEFIERLLHHIPQNLLAQLAGIDDIAAILSPELRIALTVASVIGTLALIGYLWRYLRTEPALRFFLMALLLSLIPASAFVFQTGRLLMISSIAGAPLVAALLIKLYRAWQQRNPSKSLLPTLTVVTALLLFGTTHIALHVFASTHFFYKNHLTPVVTEKPNADAKNSTSSKEYTSLLDVSNLNNKHLILLNAPIAFSQFYWPLTAIERGQSLPISVHIIAPAHTAYTLTTINDNEFEISSEDGLALTSDILLKGTIPGELWHRNYYHRHLDTILSVDAEHLWMTKQKIIANNQNQRTVVLAFNEEKKLQGFRYVLNEHIKESERVILEYFYDCRCFKETALPTVGERLLVNGL